MSLWRNAAKPFITFLHNDTLGTMQDVGDCGVNEGGRHLFPVKVLVASWKCNIKKVEEKELLLTQNNQPTQSEENDWFKRTGNLW